MSRRWSLGVVVALLAWGCGDAIMVIGDEGAVQTNPDPILSRPTTPVTPGTTPTPTDPTQPATDPGLETVELPDSPGFDDPPAMNTPEETPEDTPEDTPEETPDETPEETPEETDPPADPPMDPPTNTTADFPNVTLKDVNASSSSYNDMISIGGFGNDHVALFFGTNSCGLCLATGSRLDAIEQQLASEGVDITILIINMSSSSGNWNDRVPNLPVLQDKSTWIPTGNNTFVSGSEAALEIDTTPKARKDSFVLFAPDGSVKHFEANIYIGYGQETSFKNQLKGWMGL